MDASKRLNANTTTAYALLGEAGNVQYVFMDEDLAREVLEDWRSGPASVNATMESVDLVESSLDELTEDA